MPPKKRAVPSQLQRHTKKAKLDRSRGQPSTWGFFKLPPEIRNSIYSYICVFSTTRAAVTLQNAYEGCPQRAKKQPTISATCRAVREECLSIYYSKNNFAAMINDFDLKPLCSWLKNVTPDFLQMIPSLSLVFDCGIATPLNPVPWLRLKESGFSDSTTIQYRGHPIAWHRFENMCEIGQSLRTEGMGWSHIDSFMEKCNKLANVPGLDELNDIFYEVDPDGFFDESHALHSEFCPHLCDCGEGCHCLDRTGDLHVCEDDDCDCRD